MLYNPGPDDDRVLISGTGKDISFPSQSVHWYAYETLETVAHLLCQLLMLHEMKKNTLTPLVSVMQKLKECILYLECRQVLS